MTDAALTELTSWCGQNGVEVVDFRDLDKWPRNKEYPTAEYGHPPNKERAEPKGTRGWDKITAIMLHTTAVSGMSKNRGLGIPCHFYVPKEPALVLCHDLERIVYHGHTANSFSAGIEITGVSDWDDPSQIERVRAILRYFKARRLAEAGADAPYYVMAHRQSHESRVNDPGKPIWQDAGEWAIKELGYQLGPVVGSGRTIDEWRS